MADLNTLTGHPLGTPHIPFPGLEALSSIELKIPHPDVGLVSLFSLSLRPGPLALFALQAWGLTWSLNECLASGVAISTEPWMLLLLLAEQSLASFPDFPEWLSHVSDIVWIPSSTLYPSCPVCVTSYAGGNQALWTSSSAPCFYSIQTRHKICGCVGLTIGNAPYQVGTGWMSIPLTFP